MSPSNTAALTPPMCALGLGCVTFGREIDPAVAWAMMDFAWQAGWAIFDTAAVYGDGASERIVGEWAQARSPAAGAPIIATKILPPYEAETVLSRVQASLDRLQLKRADVLYLHQWHETALHPAVLATLQTAIDQGLVRTLGVSNFNAEQVTRMLALQSRGGFQRIGYLQNIHNYVLSGFDRDLVAICVQAEIRRIGYSPLGAGFLTGKYREGVPAGTRFDLIPGHQAIYFTPTAQRRLARLLAVAERTGLSATALALAWALRQPAVSLVLVGGRSVGQLQQAIDAPTKIPVEALRSLERE